MGSPSPPATLPTNTHKTRPHTRHSSVNIQRTPCRYLSLLSSDEHTHRFRFNAVDLALHMKIDTAAVPPPSPSLPPIGFSWPEAHRRASRGGSRGWERPRRFLSGCLRAFLRGVGPQVRALSLLPSATDINKNCNLFGLLNKCKTAIGQRLLLQWIKQPLLDMGTALSAPPGRLPARTPARTP